VEVKSRLIHLLFLITANADKTYSKRFSFALMDDVHQPFPSWAHTIPKSLSGLKVDYSSIHRFLQVLLIMLIFK